MCCRSTFVLLVSYSVDGQMGNSVPYSNVGLEGIILLHTRATWIYPYDCTSNNELENSIFYLIHTQKS